MAVYTSASQLVGNTPLLQLTALEKKLNIQASNGFFSRKRREYEKSAIAATRRIAEQHTEWSVDDILERDEQLIDLISNTLQEWGLNQTAPLDE